MRLGTREIPVTLQRIDEIIDPDTLEPREAEEAQQWRRGVVTLVSRELIAADINVPGRASDASSSCATARSSQAAASTRSSACARRGRDQRHRNDVVGRAVERAARNGHAAASSG